MTTVTLRCLQLYSDSLRGELEKLKSKTALAAEFSVSSAAGMIHRLELGVVA